MNNMRFIYRVEQFTIHNTTWPATNAEIDQRAKTCVSLKIAAQSALSFTTAFNYDAIVIVLASPILCKFCTILESSTRRHRVQ